jgi:AcrR family transcriptional regulator
MSEETKDKIIEASVGLFVRKGIAATTTRDIAAAASIAEGTIYRHFPSKEALAEEIFLSNYLPFARTLEDIQKCSSTSLRKLETMVRHFYDAFDRDPAIFAFMLITQHNVMGKIPDGTPTPVGVFRSVIKEGVESGAVRHLDPQLATHLIIGLILQPATAHVHGQINGLMASRANDVVDAIWRVLSP